MSIDVQTQVTVGGVPTNGIADDPEIEIVRTDTGAIVQAAVAMVDLSIGGLYHFVFTPSIANLSYQYSIDKDPNVTNQVQPGERFAWGGFDDELDELYRIRGLDAPNKTVTENTPDVDYTEAETGDGADITLDHVKVAGVTTVTRS
jgi:hypothetical protein